MRAFEDWALAYFLNSLWQVPLIFLVAWMAVRAVRRAGVAMQHRLWVCALLLEALLPACSLDPGVWLHSARQLAFSLWGKSAPQHGTWITVQTGEGWTHGIVRLPSALSTGVAVAYGCSVLYFAVRLIVGLWRTRALRQRAELTLPAGRAALSWQRCSQAFDVSEARVAVSSRICGPMTIGIRRRLLLLPAGWLETLSGEDLEAAIAHECAHMRRRDFAKNLLYQAVALPVAYHPLQWLTRSRVTESREMLCDAMAAEVVAGRQNYARSLLRLASKLSDRTQTHPLHAIGIFDANNFERRVMNLTQNSNEIKGIRKVAVTAACVALGLGTCASALALRMNFSVPNASGVVAIASPVEVHRTAAPVEVAAPQSLNVIQPQPKLQPIHRAAVATVTAPVEAAEGPEAPQAAAPMVIPGKTMTGNLLSKINPVYPQAARDAKVQGSVVLHAVIGKDGVVQKLDVVSGPAELRASAIDAVRKWTYKPYLLNGNPMEVETDITVNYHMAE